MPWKNVPKSKWPQMERCVTDLKAKGKTEEAANAICYTSIMGDHKKMDASGTTPQINIYINNTPLIQSEEDISEKIAEEDLAENLDQEGGEIEMTDIEKQAMSSMDSQTKACVMGYMKEGQSMKDAMAACQKEMDAKTKVDHDQDLEKAVWTTAYIDTLPDSSFAYISPGGKKDKDGKTTPRSLRHLPYKDASGKVDPAHVRNALARLPQTDIPAEAKASAKAKLLAAAHSVGVETQDNQKKIDAEGGENEMAKNDNQANLAKEDETTEEVVVPEAEEAEDATEVVEEDKATEDEAVVEDNPETPAEEVAAADKVGDLVKEILGKVDAIAAQLNSASTEGAASKKEEAPEGGVVETPVEDKASEDASPAGAESVSKVDNSDLNKIADQLTKLGDSFNKRFDGLESRINKLEEQPVPAKITSSKVVTKEGDSRVADSASQERLDQISVELDKLEDLKAHDLDRYQKERSWEKAFALIAERDQLKS